MSAPGDAALGSAAPEDAAPGDAPADPGVLYVLRYFPTLTETFVHDEIRAVGRALPVAIAAFDPRGDPHVEPPPAPVHARPHRWGWIPWLPALTLEFLRAGPAAPRVLWLAALARRYRGLHVHFAGEAAAWAREAARRAGVPYGVTVHAVDLFKPRPDLGDVLRDADLVVTISEHNRRLLAERHGVDAVVIRCGVPLPAAGDTGASAESAAESAAVPDSGTPAAPPVVLAVGRWVPKKGLDTLAAAAAHLDGVVVRLVSDAPPLAGVEVLGLRPRADVAREIARTAVFALPCRVAPDGDQDGIPVVLLEAVAAGVPVVTTAVSGIPELLDEAAAWIVPPDDPAALAAAIRAAIADPAEARRRAAVARARLVDRGFRAEDAHAAVLARLLPGALATRGAAREAGSAPPARLR